MKYNDNPNSRAINALLKSPPDGPLGDIRAEILRRIRASEDIAIEFQMSQKSAQRIYSLAARCRG